MEWEGRARHGSCSADGGTHVYKRKHNIGVNSRMAVEGRPLGKKEKMVKQTID